MAGREEAKCSSQQPLEAPTSPHQPQNPQQPQQPPAAAEGSGQAPPKCAAPCAPVGASWAGVLVKGKVWSLAGGNFQECEALCLCVIAFICIYS